MANVEIGDTPAVGALTQSDLLLVARDSDGSWAKATLLDILAAQGIVASTVASLGAATTAGIYKFATDGRKSGEGAGNGTGVLVHSDGSDWLAVDTGTAVAA